MLKYEKNRGGMHPTLLSIVECPSFNGLVFPPHSIVADSG